VVSTRHVFDWVLNELEAGMPTESNDS